MNNADMPAMPCSAPDKGAREELLLALRDAGEFTVPEIKDMANKVSLHGGLTKREYFAGLAMQDLGARSSHYQSWTHLAQDAVEMADALLAELEKTS